MPRCIWRASKIIAASTATAKDITKYYNVPPERIVVAYDGFQDLSAMAQDDSVIKPDMKPYFFFAGKVKLRKNVHQIVSALISLKERTKLPCQLIIAGDYGGEYYRSMQQELREHGFIDSVHFVGYINGEQLHSLYLNAIAFVFPSLSEGFGMPLAEAMSLGVPVITSNISAMPEVVGEAGLLVDPHSAEDISRAMESIFTDIELRKRVIQKGIEQAKKFSWDSAAGELMRQIEIARHA